ncbi:MAG: hypothetical protein EPO07_06235 [Verrucomicrobia bacterium]|nr:MAG: hypothetical protein EPO07_06235 [Verrucomicrobiota bacterium]
MNEKFHLARTQSKRAAAWSLAELLVAVAIGSLLLAVVGLLTMYGMKSFAAMGNYASLDKQSREAIDAMTKEIRQATSLVAVTNTATLKALVFATTNLGVYSTYTWDSSSRELKYLRTGWPAKTQLTECDRWDFSVCQRTASNGQWFAFYPATTPSGDTDTNTAKMISMSWKCSRTLFGTNWNTESIQTAQIVLRNKQ